MSAASHAHHVPIAQEIMRPVRSLVTFTPEMSIFDAIRLLLKHKISGAPVIDADGVLVGICSEGDCLRVVAAGEFWRDDHKEAGIVAHYMGTEMLTVPPQLDVYSLAQFFLTHSLRRLPVLENGSLVGQISRRDVLRSIEDLGKRRVSRRQYPDYRKPMGDVGARRAP